MGMSLPVLFEKALDKFWKFLISVIAIISIIELIQFIIMVGSADIDDVILNTLGASIGYFIVHLNFVRRILKLDLD